MEFKTQENLFDTFVRQFIARERNVVNTYMHTLCVWVCAYGMEYRLYM